MHGVAAKLHRGLHGTQEIADPPRFRRPASPEKSAGATRGNGSAAGGARRGPPAGDLTERNPPPLESPKSHARYLSGRGDRPAYGQ